MVIIALQNRFNRARVYLRSVCYTLAALIVLTAMQVQKPARVIFFGDSITRAGAEPGGYITLMREAAGSGFELIGAGIGGNKVYDLYLRMDDDVLAKKPDVVVIYIGVNDVWHKQTALTGTDPDKFVKFYAALIKKIQEKGIKVVLCTPAVIGEKTDFSNPQDGDMNAYSAEIRKLAVQFNCRLVDLRKIFLEYNLKNNPDNKPSGILTTDRVHLNQAGNRLVADEILKAIRAL